MYRLYLTLFFFCLFSHFDAYSQIEKQLELKEVSVDTITQKITLSWYLNMYALNEEVKICRCSSYCFDQSNYPPYDYITMHPDSLVWIEKDTCTSRYFYCIAWGESGKSAPLNNMVLKVDSIKHGCQNSVLLTWNPYIYYTECEWIGANIRGKMDTIDYDILYREKNAGTPFSILGSIKGSYFSTINPYDTVHYEAKYLKNIEYEFAIRAINRSNTTSSYSYSNIVNFTPRTEADAPVSVEITKVSVLEDKYIQIDVETDAFSKPFEKLYLFRDQTDNNSPLLLNIMDSADYEVQNQYSFIDEQADPKSGLYYYMAMADNKCKLNDTSNILTNIYLTGRRVEKYKDSIYFYREGSPHLNTLEEYELFRVVNDQEISIFNFLTLVYNSYYADVENFLEGGAQVVYQIKSSDDCYSNTLTIEHEPRILFPNAFYPESAQEENKTFYPIISFPSEENYLFVILNRWGQEVYRSTLPPVYGDYSNPQGRWNGTFQGKTCPPGMYAFKVTYTYNENSKKYSETGSFMLVR